MHAGDAVEIESDFGVADARRKVLDRIFFDIPEIAEPRLRDMGIDGEVDDVVFRHAACTKKFRHAINFCYLSGGSMNEPDVFVGLLQKFFDREE